MTAIRRLAWLALVLGFGQVVFGAIVRITGSGMGCGDHWPKCMGQWIPPLTRPDLIIEVSHRYFAATLTVALVALVAVAWFRRAEPGVGGRDGVLRPSALAAGLVVVAALFGAITVWMKLANKLVIVTHLSLAMTLLAVLVATIARAGGPPRKAVYDGALVSPSPSQRTVKHSTADWTASPRTVLETRVAAILTFLAVVLGALTANVPGANVACTGFPLCRGSILPTDPMQYLQFTHRIIAFVLFLQVGWLGVALTRRGERRLAVMARIILSALFLQLVLAASMVEYRLPPLLRSLHEAVGTLLWILTFAFAYLARRRASGSAALEAARGAVAPREVPA